MLTIENRENTQFKEKKNYLNIPSIDDWLLFIFQYFPMHNLFYLIELIG